MKGVPITAALVALGCFAAACDKCPPASSQTDVSKESPGSRESSGQPESPSSAEAETEQTSLDDHRAGRWKANDVHTHLDPEAYPVVERIFENNDVFRAVNLSGGHGPDYRTRHLERSDALGDRIALFFNVDWDGIDDENFGQRTADELADAVEQGFAGLKISKSLGLEVENEEGDLVPVDTPKLDPLWERAGELGVPVTIHTADPKAFFEEPGPQNERWEELKEAPDWSVHGEEYPSKSALLEARNRMVARHPDTTFILAHMANNPENMEAVAELLERHDNLYLDTSARIAEFGRHSADEIREFFLRFQDRILFGTDLGVQAKRTSRGLLYKLFLGSVRKEEPKLEDVEPFFEKHWRYFESDEPNIPHPIPIQGDWKVHPIDLPHRVLRKIYWENAERIVFAPWLGRRAAQRAAERARDLLRRGSDSGALGD